MFCDNGLSKHFKIQGQDFSRAGRASTHIKEILQEVGIDPAIIRRAAIACYEAEMNVVMYAQKADLWLSLTPEKLTIRFEDQGPGALEAMRNINSELDELMGEATKDLEKTPTFLYDVQQSILKCLQIEKGTFQTLGGVI